MVGAPFTSAGRFVVSGEWGGGEYVAEAEKIRRGSVSGQVLNVLRCL